MFIFAYSKFCINFAARMRNLARHIELLLRDNDCVILPGFGGFIAQTVPAYYVSEEALYYPPSRSICFNAAITMNDGLLAQSYMKSYQVDYARASYMVDIAIEKLCDALDEEGMVTLPHIGTIKQDVYQSIQFIPEEAGVSSPLHFGLGSFLIKELHLLHESTEVSKQPQSVITHTAKTIDVHINKSVLRQVISTAAVLLLLLMVSLPIGNHKPTDIASLHLTDVIATPVVKQQAPIPAVEATIIEGDLAVDVTTVDTVAAMSHLIVPTDMPVIEEAIAAETITDEAIQPAEIAAEIPQASAEVLPEKVYHIIVASLPNHRGAEETMNQYINKGYPNVSLVERDNRIRISLVQFTDKDEANNYLKELRQIDAFQSAWLLAVRN